MVGPVSDPAVLAFIGSDGLCLYLLIVILSHGFEVGGGKVGITFASVVQ